MIRTKIIESQKNNSLEKHMKKFTELIKIIFMASIVMNLFIFLLEKNNWNKSYPLFQKQLKPTEDLVFIIDLSSTMLSKDFQPNRIEAVKSILRKIINEKENQQRIGIVIFAGEAMILCPLTKNSNILREKVDSIEIGILTDGTAISTGILFGLYELSKSTNENKEIIILTDGVNTVKRYSFDLVVQLSNQQGVRLHSLGVGCNGKAIGPIMRRSNGEFVFGERGVSIDEKTLKLVGDQTKGNYLRVTCNADLDTLRGLNYLLENSNTESSTSTFNNLSNKEINKLWEEIKMENENVTNKFYSPNKNKMK